ncbi:unnamed protein product [Rotaria magnacalcarata]|uniref:Uncharacterized protein n=2 Tax=Rotaria magnacalcarata TaxID=392030 RepID=A0A819JU02_9BILA|nr:unnamed protein product [Rotaria magnacalcarata]CAF4453432.1 unnamed protein product [Rotaria magnacalcarata]
MASIRPCLVLVSKITGRRQFSLSQCMRLKDNWDQECLLGVNLPFNTSAVAIPFLAMRWQLLKKRAG